MIKYIFAVFILFLCSCDKLSKSNSLFQTLGAETGIAFENKVENNDEMNIFKYRNFYNGAGVAVGDINNDGLADVYMVANQGPNKLFLNKGDFKFDDISINSKSSGTHTFSTGAVMADVNGDGFLDIYVCNSGEKTGDSRANELFINNKNNTFTESAEEYGLADKGYSTHAAFFDYDIDGDLDMFLLENSSFPVNKLGFKNIRNERDPLAGQKLFKNNEGKFEDVSAQAGIYGSLIGFGLGITIGDFNNDLYPDIYIANDFYERDYLYMNNKNGGFKEDLTNQLSHISLSSMGADVADINNDGHLDIFSTDMLPWDDYRLKTTMSYDDVNLSDLKLNADFYHQYSRNMLHINNANNSFSEVGSYAGVQATDWSWGALIFDMDTDGKKDLFVANGIYKNVTDQDFVQFLNEDNTLQPYLQGQKKFDYKIFVDKMEAKPTSNYAFKNNGDLNFSNEAQNWGLSSPSFSSGAAYADFDNDGDLDLIINNTNQPVGIFKNQSIEKNKVNFCKVKLKGNLKNTFGIGARVKLYQGNDVQTLEQMPNRGFESSVDYIMNFGLGNNSAIDSVITIWPSGKTQKIIAPKSNIVLTFDINNAQNDYLQEIIKTKDFDITLAHNLSFEHKENYFIDYDRDGLLKQMYSREGPALAVADVDGNGTEDVFFGAAMGEKSKLMLQNTNGKFSEMAIKALDLEKLADVVDAQFFDADNDKDLDLLLITGGNENYSDSPKLKDILLINDGKGNFSVKSDFPIITQSGSSAAIFDADADGDNDIFIAGRSIPVRYGEVPKHYLMINDGKGTYVSQEQNLGLGMISDVAVADINNDSLTDLVLVQDWGEIAVLENKNGKFTKSNIENTSGWWNRISAKDIDNDGDMDFVVGNLGTNSRLVASQKNPANLIIKDFDNNLRLDHIYECVGENGKMYPMVLKTDLQKQIPAIKQKFIYFKDFGAKTSSEIFTEKLVNDAQKLSVKESRSGILINDKGKLKFEPLPYQAQFSPVFGIEFFDYNNDSLPDLLLTGNFYDVQSELGRYDANYGQIFLNKGKGKFEYVPYKNSGLRITGQIRNSKRINIKGVKQSFILAKNNNKAQLISL